MPDASPAGQSPGPCESETTSLGVAATPGQFAGAAGLGNRALSIALVAGSDLAMMAGCASALPSSPSARSGKERALPLLPGQAAPGTVWHLRHLQGDRTSRGRQARRSPMTKGYLREASVVNVVHEAPHLVLVRNEGTRPDASHGLPHVGFYV